MRRISNCVKMLSLLSVAAFSVVSVQPAAADPVEFVLAANDGYGVEDCLLGARECGQTVADAWCEAHGQGNAIRFGLQRISVPAHGAETLEITCGD